MTVSGCPFGTESYYCSLNADHTGGHVMVRLLAVLPVLETDPVINAADRGCVIDNPPPVTPGPLVSSAMLEMIALADNLKCMACGRKFVSLQDWSEHELCTVEFAPSHPGFLKWKQRVQILALVRHLEIQKLEPATNHDRVQNAAAGAEEE